MNCLCCGKPLRTPDETGWHKACIKRFFGTTKLPEIKIDDKTLNLLATETTNKGFTVPGVQKKLSLQRQPQAEINTCKLSDRLYSQAAGCRV